jgi:hypothetical protein
MCLECPGLRPSGTIGGRMISFNTIIPLKKGILPKDILGVSKQWIEKSPNYLIGKLIEKSQFIDGTIIRNETESLEVVEYANKNIELAGCRFIVNSNEILWTTDIVTSLVKNACQVSIIITSECEKATTVIPKAKKPYIVKELLRTCCAEYDDDIPINRLPFRVNENNYEIASKIVNGISSNIMPVIYVSCAEQNQYYVDVEKLTLLVSGLGHVLVEENKRTSYKLKEITSSKNVYNGAIGIYWPGSSESFLYFPKPYQDKDTFSKFIYSELLDIWNSIRPYEKCRWSVIQEWKSKQKLDELKKKDEKELTEYIEIYEQEIKAKNEDIKNAEEEISKLRSQNEMLKNRSSGYEQNGLLAIGKETDLYLYEKYDFVVEILEKELSQITAISRKKHVIESIIDVNRKRSVKRELLSEIKAVLDNYRSMDAKTRSTLSRCGFEIIEDGKHYKLIFNNDHRYIITLAKTPSDVRNGKNTYSDLKKLCF